LSNSLQPSEAAFFANFLDYVQHHRRSIAKINQGLRWICSEPFLGRRPRALTTYGPERAILPEGLVWIGLSRTEEGTLVAYFGRH
jgi:hypothetical protein